ncbi:hypothetical protein ATCV1_z639R [Acanthocystis turfacea chlorella virus 1]|uniref:Uncharacterized protein z639R n=1 Tax=Chlorovirus heliozoae TaxID=322019 RepID=A7K9P9_9PHYC|nr:hypothetical protein ATCV1_z639R [Acanthocystis turfacea chlorella virus 1]ABT16773.1 hypothetical protein ATCV1_z639R [Acanthocystis turfacea chlorella virus 1]
MALRSTPLVAVLLVATALVSAALGSAGLGAAVRMMVFLTTVVVFICLGLMMVSRTTVRFLAASMAAREAAMRAQDSLMEAMVLGVGM